MSKDFLSYIKNLSKARVILLMDQFSRILGKKLYEDMENRLQELKDSFPDKKVLEYEAVSNEYYLKLLSYIFEAGYQEGILFHQKLQQRREVE